MIISSGSISSAWPNPVCVDSNLEGRQIGLPHGAKNLLQEDHKELFCIDKNGRKYVMPDIEDVKVNYANDCLLRVTVFFSDGTSETARALLGEIFRQSQGYSFFASVDQGISICITKKLLSARGLDGTSVYNKLVSRAIKVMRRKKKERAREIQEQNEKKRIHLNRIEKKRKRKARLRKQEEERQIRIQTEAILRAEKIKSDRLVNEYLNQSREAAEATKDV